MTNIEQKLDEILGQLKNLNERVERIETEQAPAGASIPESKGNRKMSIKEFFLQFKPKNEVQKTLVIASYLETHEGLSSFNKADLERGYRLAKEPVPSNINDKVNKCIKSGLMMEDTERKDNMKSWVITNTGETCLKEMLSKE